MRFGLALAICAGALLGCGGAHREAPSRQAPTRETPPQEGRPGYESDSSRGGPSSVSSSQAEEDAAQSENNEEDSAAGPAAEDARPALRTLTGRASYYADALAGNRTASGERYDPRALTAASRDLPFGTVVRVTRLPEGPSVIVRVNDRGPFRDHRRILDLSRAAAERLGMIRAGVVEVRAEILELP